MERYKTLCWNREREYHLTHFSMYEPRGCMRAPEGAYAKSHAHLRGICDAAMREASRRCGGRRRRSDEREREDA